MANLIDNSLKSTLNRPIGLLADGVELYSPSLFNESIYFGQIEDIQILNNGQDYDVITPPIINISDTDGYGQNAKISANMKGALKDVLIISPGIGYKYKPSLSIKGGNIKGSIKLETNLVKKVISSNFFVNDTGVGSSTINFSGDHNFQDNEEVIYNSNGTPAVVGLTTGSTYFVGKIDSNTISLYRNFSDATNKINYIDNLSTIVGVNTGIQSFSTVNFRNIIDQVYIENNEAELYNKSIKIQSISYPNTDNSNGINTSLNYIYAENHNFNEKDLVVYESSLGIISGLSTTTQYYVTIIDSNSFKLSDAGNGNIPDETDYQNKVYVNLNSIGSGEHIFRYPPITIDVSIVSESSNSTPPVLRPVVLGSIDSIFIENKGVGYGLSEVVNVKKYPEISIEGQNYFKSNLQNQAVLRAVIEQGKIVNVLILNSGDDYQDNIDIIVGGNGNNAKLHPIVENGKITNVLILSPGNGYDEKNTRLFVQRRGKNAKLVANLTKWTINQYFKNKDKVDSNLNPNNGFVIPSRNLKNSYQFVNFYPSKILRENLNDSKAKLKSSPILGWAYDGNPIFGPYEVEDGIVKSIKSGYSINGSSLTELTNLKKRPPSSSFGFGYFIEDYEYMEGSSKLDEHNGMFINGRDEFPNGTYAYFMTVDIGDSPEFPYVVGNQFKNTPNPLNYDASYNQSIDFSQKNYIKNTSALYLSSINSGYDYLKPMQDKYKQEIIVKNILGSDIDGFEVIDSGQNYKVGDKLVFSVTDENIPSPDAKISRINGKTISNITTGITTLATIKFKSENNKIIGITTHPNNLLKNDYVYISECNLVSINGTKKVNVNNKTLTLYSNHSNSGVSTYIQLGSINGISVEDLLKIDDEVVKVLEIHPNVNKLFVQRIENIQSHTSGISTVELLPTKFEFYLNNFSDKLSDDNLRYFNPRISVGLGSTGSIISDSNTNSYYFIPSRAIYIPNHNFQTNQPLVYSYDSNFNGLLVSNQINSTTYRLQNNQTVYAVKIDDNFIGISTVAYGQTSIVFRESSFSGDEIHSFNYEGTQITGKGENYKINVTTNEAHELLDGDLIRLTAVEDTWDFYVVKFDLNQDYPITKNTLSSFSISLNDKPEYIRYPQENSLDLVDFTSSNVRYNTRSKNAKGGVNSIATYSSGNFYYELPILEKIDSESGGSGVIIPYSNKIGRIDFIERVKDGFDYPSDITLQPKLSKTTICYLDNVSKIDKVSISYGGVKYNTPPSLKVIGNDEIKLNCTIKNSTVDSVSIVQNSSRLSIPLQIIPINNSNGFDILNVYQLSPNTNRIIIDTNQFPLIYRDYAEPIVDFPFKIGDSIFIENCRIEESDKNTYNSTDNYYSFFTVTGINSFLGYIDYSTSGVQLINSVFGTYSVLKGYGTVVNKNNMAKFEMSLVKDNYIPGEYVKVISASGEVKFTGKVYSEDGWDSNRNQLRIFNSDGILDVGDIVLGLTSLMKGKVLYLSDYAIKSKFGPTRDKVNYKDNISDLNNDSKRLQDSYFYQDFSYSIHSKIPYQTWSEPVKSIVHPSGFVEFSNLEILSSSTKNLRIKTTDNILDFDVKIENENSFYTKSNYTICYENEKINEFTTERIYTGSGQDLWQIAGDGKQRVGGLELLPYILNKTNKVKPLKKISPEFTGSYETISLGNYSVTFDSNAPYYLGISTSNLEVGDIVGFSTYHQYPYDTRIISIGVNSVRTLNPHNVLTGIITESLEIKRNLNYNKIVGLTSFTLVAEDDSPVYKLVGVASDVDLSTSSIILNHNFQTGQIVHYENIGGIPIGISTTSEVIGGGSTDILPSTLYVTKISNSQFKVSGLSTSLPLQFTNQGTGIHKFIFDSPNESTIILIDNLFQVPVRKRLVDIELLNNVGIGTTVLYVNSGITSVSSIDIIKLEDEYLKINSIGITSTNSIEVERGFLGTEEKDHTGIITANIYRGNYRINEDVIYFTDPPYGKKGLPSLEVSSIFSGRVFSRTFSPNYPNDKNLILDDISDEFVGISSFTLYENGNNIVGLYTNTNSSISINIDNNPLVFINNIPQVVNTNFEIFNPNQNKIKFLNGEPKTGRILSFDLEGGFGYSPLVAAAATVRVSAAGTIAEVYLNGNGSGYRTPPVVNIISSTGYGASITASINSVGIVTSLTIINSGIGYTTSENPIVIIDAPIPCYNLDLNYSEISTGIGEGAKVSLIVESNTSIQKVEIVNSGKNYKVGEQLNVVGLKTDVGIGSSFIPLTLTVKEVVSDDFSGIYPGQFIQFDDISNQFNSVKTSFDITANIDGDKRVISFKNRDLSLNVEDNFLIFINDILQEPSYSYKYIGGRVVFSEPPKERSTCNILYYVGSINDIELIVPAQTIKSGDVVKFEYNELNPLSSEQTDRVVKRLISVNSLDTFPYSGFGITSIVRPISWTKQKNDRIISGSLIPKGRDTQRSKIYPSAKLIKPLSESDTEIYVDSAYPLFTKLDDGPGGITNEKRNLNIIKNNELIHPEFNINVSSSSSISSIDVISTGLNYGNNPFISISLPKYKDPIYNLNSIEGLTNILDINSLVSDTETLVAVGNSNLLGVSTDIKNWSFSSINLPYNIDFNKIIKNVNNDYISVGSSGVIVRSDNGYYNWNTCSTKQYVLGPLDIILGLTTSTYNQSFNDIIYNEYVDCYVAVGDGGKIYTASGISTNTFIEVFSQSFDYKSIAYNQSLMVAVGHQGITTSSNGISWLSNLNMPPYNYESIYWDGSRFILTSNVGVYISHNGIDWSIINGSPNYLNKISKINDIYVSIGSDGSFYKSLNLIDWTNVLPLGSGIIKDFNSFNYNGSNYQVSVGAAGTSMYSEIKLHKAELNAIVSNTQITDINITDGGFGYDTNQSLNILIEPPTVESEMIYSVDAVGDYGTIVGIKTSNSGIGTDSPSISFELLTEYSNGGYDSLNTYGVTYSQLDIGDYFIVTNSNVNTTTGYAITGITTSLGGMANYPESKVGTATSFLDGVYRVEFVQSTTAPQGIVTVTCHVYPVNGGIGINTSGVTTNYYGNYSWSKFFGYQDRAIRNPLNFKINTDNGLIGLSTSPEVLRNPPLVF